MNTIYLFECDIVKYESEELIETIHCLAYNLFQATHEFHDYVFAENSKYSSMVEIGRIKRISSVKNIINPYFAIEQDMEEELEDYDPEMPYKVVQSLKDDDVRVMTFKCSCHESIRVSSGNWLYIKCKNCNNTIHRREIEEIGGMYIYTGNKN